MLFVIKPYQSSKWCVVGIEEATFDTFTMGFSIERAENPYLPLALELLI